MSMLRKVSIGLVLAASVAGVSVAQQAQGRQGGRAQRGQQGGPEGRGPGGPGGPGGRGMRGGPERALFQGITLTDAEQAKVKTIRRKYRDEGLRLRDANEDKMDANREQLRAAREKKDTVALKAFRAKAEESRTQFAQLMQRQQGEVRGALTAEHQKQFDTNVAQLKDRMAQRGQGGPQGGARRGGRGGQGGQGFGGGKGFRGRGRQGPPAAGE
ncbi:MAG: protein of unknown function Spy-related protein [Gemmatimonadetes bacterium]|nr:protein of unknown function Spy-related protein [Gemmatimonadota bacterium]